MSSLQVGLAVAGGLILGGVIAYNTWNARRHQPRQAQPEAPAPAERVEPGLQEAMAAPERQEPSFDAEAALPSLGPLPLPDKRPRLDALIDVIAPIALDGRVVSGDALLAALPATRRVGSKPFAVEGQHDTRGEWEFPQAGQRYHAVQAGVQLANRTGPLNDIEFSEFVMCAQRYADAVGGAPEFPDMLHEVARARELDQFASAHDAQLAIVLRARQASWTPGYVQQMALRHGFVPGAIAGRLVLPSADEGAPPILTLSFDAQAALAEDPQASSLRELTLALDVPQTPEALEPFASWQEVSRGLSRDIEADVCDDRGQVLPLQAFAAIGQELSTLYHALASRDLAAGSLAARRLFS